MDEEVTKAIKTLVEKIIRFEKKIERIQDILQKSEADSAYPRARIIADIRGVVDDDIHREP